MARSRSRRPRLRRNSNRYRMQYELQGPIEEDGVSGWKYPRREMVRQRGVWVSRRYTDGSRDRPAKSDWT